MSDHQNNMGGQAIAFGIAAGFMQACTSTAATVDWKHLLVAALFACVTGFCYRMAGRLADKVKLGKSDKK